MTCFLLLVNVLFLTESMIRGVASMNARASLLHDLNPGSSVQNSLDETFPFSSNPTFTNIDGRLFISAFSDGGGDGSRDGWVADPELRRIDLLNETDPILFYEDSKMGSVYIFAGNSGVFQYNLTTKETMDIFLAFEHEFTKEGYQFFEHSTGYGRNLFCFQAIPKSTGFEINCLILGEFATIGFLVRGVRNPKYFVSFQGLIFFSGDHVTTNATGKLYYVDISNATTDFEGDSAYSPAQTVDVGVEFNVTETPTIANDKLFIRQTITNMNELWALNYNNISTLSATSLVDQNLTDRYGQITSLRVVNDRVVFAFTTGVLWSTDGESLTSLFDNDIINTPYFELEPSTAIFRGNLYVASLNSIDYTNGTHGFRLNDNNGSFGRALNLVPISDDMLCFFCTEIINEEVVRSSLRCTNDGNNSFTVSVKWPGEERPQVQPGAVEWNGRLVFPAYTSTEGSEPYVIDFDDSAAWDATAGPVRAAFIIGFVATAFLFRLY